MKEKAVGNGAQRGTALSVIGSLRPPVGWGTGPDAARFGHSAPPPPSSLSLPRAWLPNMNYLLAILLPPVSILLTGRPLLAILVFLIWIPAVILSGGLTHPMFILLAWFIIFQSRESRMNRRDG